MRNLRECPNCGEHLYRNQQEPDWLVCFDCDLEFEAEDFDVSDEESDDFFEDDDTSSFEGYGRHRTRLRDSDQ